MSKQQTAISWQSECNDFDYNNVDPDTLKEWEAELRRENWRDMRSYLKQFPDATQQEKRALRSWVRSGHSPYENGDYIANESGEPMDFINASRCMEELYQEYLKDPEGFCRQVEEQRVNIYSSLSPDSDDLPF